MCSCEVLFGRKAYELYALDCSAIAHAVPKGTESIGKQNLYTA